MLFRFFSLLVLACVWCVSSQAQEDVSPKRDNFYEELERNFVPAPARKTTRRVLRSFSWPELTENNASEWGSFAADKAATTLSNDTSKVKVGAASLLFTTKSGADTGVRYPASGEAHLNVASKDRFVFWAYGYNTNSNAFQGNQPIVVLRCAGGTIRYTPTTQVMSNDFWRYYSIPLAGDSSWTRTNTDNPDLSDVLSIEIHQDTWGDSFSVYYDGVAFKDAIVRAEPPTNLSPDVISPRILLYCFDPVMENLGGVRQHQTHGWRDPVVLTQQVLADLKSSSHNLYQPQIVETKVADEHPYFVDGFQHTDESFENAWNVPQGERDFHQTSIFDYPRFCREHNIVSRIESGELDEVWIYAGPINGTWESTMVGNGAYWLNSSPPPIKGQRLFPIMGLNFERGVGEAIHSFGHRCESIMARCYGGWQNNQSTSWNKFTLRDQLAPGLGGVGNVHFPVNGTSDYDWGNMTPVLSNSDDWSTYPLFQNITRTFNSTEWSPTRFDLQREYLNWWYSHMPHGGGVATDGFLNNWWRYLADLDQFKSWNGNLAATEGFPHVSIESPSNGAFVSGTVNIKADGFVDGAMGRVDFYVDGVYQSSDTLAPYIFSWDTTGLDGVHRLEARAFELSVGNQAVSAPVLVNVGEKPVPVLSVSDATIIEGNEGNTDISFTVTRTGDANIASSVAYATADGTAKEDSDYTSTSGTLLFEPGQTEHTVVVPVVGDSEGEADETFSLKLSSPTLALLGNANGTGTIQNDDAAISVNDVAVDEGEQTAQAQFTVTLSPAVPVAVDVNYTTSTDETLPDAATANEDFTPASGVLHFEPNQTSATVTVPVLNDSLFEHDEQFLLDVSGVAAIKSRGIGTVKNDDAKPVISVQGPASSLEGNASTHEVKFTVSLSAPSKLPASVAYTTVPGESDPATANEDFVPASGTLTFEPGQVEKTITVAVKEDTDVEADETFSLDLSASTEASLGETASQAKTTIQNDDTKASVNDVTVLESGKTSTFAVTLSPKVPVAVDIAYATSKSPAQNAAAPDVDFTSTSGTLHFEPNQETASVAVPIVNDSGVESDEVFLLGLSNATGSAATFSKAQGVGTIQNDDTNVSVGDITLLEGNVNFKAAFTVTLSHSVPVAVDVSYTTSSIKEANAATLGEDYTLTSGTLRFAPNQKSATVAVPIVGDARLENDELFYLSISTTSGSGANVTKARGVATLRNDDAGPAVSVAAPRPTFEGNSGTTPVVFKVSLSKTSGLPVAVSYSVAPGKVNPATANQDYVVTSGTLVFIPGETSKNVTVFVRGDTLDETDENFSLSLALPKGATLITSSATALITDDDTGLVSVGTATVAEGNTGQTVLRFPVSMSLPNTRPVVVTYATGVAGVGASRATAGGDYIVGSGTVTLAPGQTRTTIDVRLVGDTTNEEDERFAVSLKQVQNASLGERYAEGVIRNDDAPARVSVSDFSINEGNRASSVTFVVSLSGVSGRPVSVSYTTAPGTATQGSDFTSTSGTLVFAPGETQKHVSVPVVGDLVRENNETFLLKLSNLQNGLFARAAATCTLLNDDK